MPFQPACQQRNPEVDRITDHKNLTWLSKAVPTLEPAFYFTGREAYAEQAARLVRVWFLDPATRMRISSRVTSVPAGNTSSGGQPASWARVVCRRLAA